MVDAEKVVKSYEDMMGSMLAMMNMFIVLSAAAGAILIYNISMINLRERVTEFGTLMVMGSFVGEAGRMILMEQTVYTVFGLLLGIPGSFGIKWLIETIVMSESYTIHMSVGPKAYGISLLLCLAMTLFSWAMELKFLKGIRLTEILKERE